MTPPIPRSRQRRKDARPAELTAAALTLFVERGYASTRLEDVAAHAGVSKGTLYLYFKNKEELFKAVISEGVVPIIEAGEALIEKHRDDPERLLREILLGWWQLVGETPQGGIPKLMIAEARNFPEITQFYFDEVVVRGQCLIGTALELGLASGVFLPIDIGVQMHVGFAPLMMLALWKHSFPDCAINSETTSRHYIEATLDLIFQGLCQNPKKELQNA
jgi:AcrR family transcriptional regulator